MFEKTKEKIRLAKEERIRRAEERARIERERIEEAARKERERIQAEKDQLMSLSEKELMVEAIMALRGYNTRILNIEQKYIDLEDRVDSLEWDVSSLESDISSLESKVK